MEAKPKKFDCVEMKRKGAARVRRETEGMTKAEQLAYWKKGTEDLLAEQEALCDATRSSRSENVPEDQEA